MAQCQSAGEWSAHLAPCAGYRRSGGKCIGLVSTAYRQCVQTALFYCLFSTRTNRLMSDGFVVLVTSPVSSGSVRSHGIRPFSSAVDCGLPTTALYA